MPTKFYICPIINYLSEMRKTKIYLLLLLSFTFLSSCKIFKKDDSKNPEAVVVKFLTFMGRLDFENAKLYGTAKTGQLLDIFSYAVATAKKTDSINKFEKRDLKVKVIKCEKQGDFAVVTYSSNQTQQDRIDLVKQNGKWLIDLKKESPQLKNFIPNNKK